MCDIQKLKLGFHACDIQAVEVILTINDEQIEICHVCWVKLAEHDGWGSKAVEQKECPEPLFGCKE